MKSSQDHIPTHELGDELALDAQGRVLRRPHFFLAAEAEEEIRRTNQIWAELLMSERNKVQEAESRAQTAEAVARRLTDRKIDDVVLGIMTFVAPKYMVRKRFHWVLRWLIRVK